MPIFADLVLSNETHLKEHLRLIFHDISEAIAQHVSGSGDQDEEHKVGDSSGGGFWLNNFMMINEWMVKFLNNI